MGDDREEEPFDKLRAGKAACGERSRTAWDKGKMKSGIRDEATRGREKEDDAR
jgi:hypothetical protein